MDEPEIIINGVKVPTTAAMTIRVAIQNFAFELQSEGLGEDEIGKGITKGYLENIQLINKLFSKTTHCTHTPEKP
jgi:hypothetical protein